MAWFVWIKYILQYGTTETTYIHWDAIACISGVRSILPNSILSNLNIPRTDR